MPRLDKKRKELQQQKDDLIKETKAKVAAIDNVRQQLDIFLKVSSIVTCTFPRGNESCLQAATEAQKKVDDLIQPLQPGDPMGSQGSQP
jgi:hypothetical protein